MFGRISLPVLAMLASVCVAAAPQPAAHEGAGAEQLLAQCEDKSGWDDPAPPVRLFGNVYDVGTCGIVSLLVTGNEGHVLIDGASVPAAPLIAANIERLGFALNEVKWILTSHEHLDHAGGLAELQGLTGAKLAVRAEQRAAIESGVVDPADPQFGLPFKFPGAHVDRIMADGEVLQLGNLALTLHSTPGHSPGSTSWTWRSCEGEVCHDVGYIDSVTAVSAGTYRFSDHPEYLTAFRRSLDRIAALGCDLIITPHPGASQLFERLAGDAPLADPNACRNYAEAGREGLESRLAREASGE